MPDLRVQLLPKQDRFVFSASKFPGFVGGIGSGKTYAGAIRSLLYASRADGMITAPTYPMLRDSTQYAFFGLLDQAGIPYEFNKSDQEAFVFGHRILFRSCEKADRLRGPNLGWVWADEAALIRQRRVWDILIGRLRIGDPSAWITTTPAGFNWVYDRWGKGDDPRYELVQASTRENSHLPSDYVHDLESSYTAEFARQEIDGGFIAFEGLVYSEFRDGVHTFDTEPPAEWTRVRGVDFGFTNPFVCLWAAIDEDGRLWIYDEHYQRQMLLGQHADHIKARGGSFEWTVADHDAQDAAELRNLGISTVKAKKDVSPGIQKVKARLIAQADGRPRLLVHQRCVNTLRELGMYRWKEGGKEEPVKENDHACDVIRYMVMHLDGRPRATVEIL